ncbi:MAG: hypothetical protein OQL19_21465 [Gammaproteobacteria bacterium]|nr:hypothetical protein [Gammaproteobacteria bacterium]
MHNKDELNQETELGSPWLDEDDWQNGQIHSNARSALYASIFFALFWNAISFPIAYFAMTDVYRHWKIDHLDPVLFVLLFPLIGIGLLFWVYKTYRQWAAFGRLSLTLDPYPGSIGGDVGGFLDLPMKWRLGYEFQVTVNCIHHTISRSGKNSSHHEKVVWKKHAAVDYESSANGIRLKFKSPIDEGLIDSEAKEGSSYYRWVVNIKGQYKESKIKLDRDFDIPVFKLKTPQTSHLRIVAAAPSVGLDQISKDQVNIKQNTRSLELSYPRSRYASMGKFLFFFSLIFVGATGFLGYETVTEIQRSNFFSLFSVGITGFMTLIFGLVSFTMLAFAIHLLSNELNVLIDSNIIKVMSQSLIHRSTKTINVSQIRKISKKTTMSSGQGTSATLYFTVSAELDNQEKVTLGNGIKGQLIADSLIKLINKQLGESLYRSQLDGTEAKVESALDDIEAKKEKFIGYIKHFKWVVNLIGFIFIMFFIFEFFSFAAFFK